MYEVDHQDSVVVLTNCPPSCPGAPLPHVAASEGYLLLAYLVADNKSNWDGIPRPVSPEGEGRTIAVIRFGQPYSHMFGPPNDETFNGHPLASRGLKYYSAHEVKDSSWIRRCERMNSAHPMHNRATFLSGGLRHFIFTFHDSTFECLAHGFTVHPFQGTLSDAMKRMIATLGS